MLLMPRLLDTTSPSMADAVSDTAWFAPAGTAAMATIDVSHGLPTKPYTTPGPPETFRMTCVYDPFRSTTAPWPNRPDEPMSAGMLLGALFLRLRRQTMKGSVGKPSSGLSVQRSCSTDGITRLAAASSMPSRRATSCQRR